MIKNIFVILILVIFVSACSMGPRSARFPLVPANFSLPKGDFPPEYMEGWKDGCESGFSAYGNDVYKAVYSFKQDIELMKDSRYYKAWNDALNYCRSYVNRYLSDGAFDQGAFANYDMRNRKVIEGTGLMMGYGKVNTPGWYGDPFAGGIPGFNQNYFEGEGDGMFAFGGSSDWLGREETPDWLGRTGKYAPNTP